MLFSHYVLGVPKRFRRAKIFRRSHPTPLPGATRVVDGLRPLCDGKESEDDWCWLRGCSVKGALHRHWCNCGSQHDARVLDFDSIRRLQFGGWLHWSQVLEYKVNISLLIPELWCRMTTEERDPKNMTEKGNLEKIDDFEYEGRLIPGRRLGCRITGCNSLYDEHCRCVHSDFPVKQNHSTTREHVLGNRNRSLSLKDSESII